MLFLFQDPNNLKNATGLFRKISNYSLKKRLKVNESRVHVNKTKLLHSV